MKREKFDRFFAEFEKLREKYGFKQMVAVELDSQKIVTGPYFGIPDDEENEDDLLVAFSLTGENGCPGCMDENCNAH